MATNTVSRYLSLTTTQGGADAFVQAQVDTEIIPADGMGKRITAIELLFTPNFLLSVAADAYVKWSLSRDTKTAIGEYSDTDIVYGDGIEFTFLTSGAGVNRHNQMWIPPVGIFLVEPIIYAQLDSNATGNTITANWRIHYEDVKLSEVEILRLLNNA